MRNFALMLGLSLVGSPCAIAIAETTEIYVSTQGNDNSSGTADQPVQSLHRAAELARESRLNAPETAVEVIVGGGEYTFTQPLVLTEQDSSSVDYPTIYKAAEGQSVTLSGAVKPNRIGLATDWEEYRSKLSNDAAARVVVYEASVDAEVWNIPVRGEAESLHPSSLQLFVQGKSFPQSCYPNQGWLRSGSEAGLAKALNRSDTDENCWIHGFPANDHQDDFKRLSDATPLNWRADSRFRIINSLQELDQAGEWYLDVAKKRILWWPISDDDSDLRVSSLETLISMYDVESVRFEGFTLEGVRVQAVEIAGGYDCEIRKCLVRCAGNVGVSIFHGEAHKVVDCQVHDTGSSGIRLEGGNRAGRVPGNHICRGNNVHHCGTQNLARHAAIAAYGVGLIIDNNTVSQQPDWAISVWGDENLVRANHIYEVCQETSDTGAIYLSDNSGYQGNLITQNHIHHVGGYSTKDAFGIYLDNQTSRNEVTANLVHDTPRAIVVRGGSENRLAANIIHSCWIGVQFQWSSNSQGNQLLTNVIESENSLLVSQSLPQALLKEQNLASTAELFVNAKTGDLRFSDQELADQLMLNERLFLEIPFTASLDSEPRITRSVDAD